MKVCGVFDYQSAQKIIRRFAVRVEDIIVYIPGP